MAAISGISGRNSQTLLRAGQGDTVRLLAGRAPSATQTANMAGSSGLISRMADGASGTATIYSNTAAGQEQTRRPAGSVNRLV